MFAILVRWGHRSPGPRVAWPLDGIVLVFIGVLVAAFVAGWGALVVGLWIGLAGVYRLATLPPGSSATGRTDGTPTVP